MCNVGLGEGQTCQNPRYDRCEMVGNCAEHCYCYAVIHHWHPDEVRENRRLRDEAAEKLHAEPRS